MAVMEAALGNPDDQEYPVIGKKPAATLGAGVQPPPQVGGQPPAGVSTTQPVGQPVLYGDPAKPSGTITSGTPVTPPVATPAATPQTATPSGPWGNAQNMGGWIDQQLAATGNTTDDPNYWRTQMGKDPKAVAGDPSAIGWWKDAIDRAEGSSLVKSGQLSLRPATNAAPGAGGAAFAPPPSYSSGAGAGGSVISGALGTGDANSLYAQLMARANQSLTPDKNDPVIRAQTDAFNAQRTLGDRNTLASLAEQSGANGNLNAATRAAGEASGQAGSQFQAGLMANEVTARRNEIQQALSGAQGLLTAEQAMSLQEEMARLDRAQQESQFGRTLAENESQFGRNLGQRGYEFDINDQYRNSPVAS